MKIHVGTGERADKGGREGGGSPRAWTGSSADSSATPTFVPLVISDVDRPHHAYTDRIGKKRKEGKKKEPRQME